MVPHRGMKPGTVGNALVLLVGAALGRDRHCYSPLIVVLFFSRLLPGQIKLLVRPAVEDTMATAQKSPAGLLAKLFQGYCTRTAAVCVGWTFVFGLGFWAGRHTGPEPPPMIPPTLAVGPLDSLPPWPIGIPKTIFQVYVGPGSLQRLPLPPAGKRRWLALNPGFEHRFVNDTVARAHLADHFTPAHLELYDALEQNMCKADFLRYCILYTHGGVCKDLGACPPQNHPLCWVRRNCMLAPCPSARWRSP